MRLVRMRVVLAGVVALEPELELQVPNIARLAAGVGRVMRVPERLPFPVLTREDRRQRQGLAGVRPDQRRVRWVVQGLPATTDRV